MPLLCALLCVFDCLGKFLLGVVLNLCVNIHRSLAVLVASKILDSFGVYTGMDQIRNVGMSKLVRHHNESGE